MTIAMVSGGFDPLHIGHIKLFEGANEHGDVVVALNSDNWLLRKKGYVFMSYAERLYILNSLSVISRVIGFDDSDDTVCEALRYLKPLFFCNGGDRSVASIEEHKVCLELNIHEVFDVGGGKIQDSSMLVRRAKV